MPVTAVRLRSPGVSDDDRTKEEYWHWHPDRVAVVVCDMWDAHHCISAERRVVEMAPRMNEVLTGLRKEGALIVHAPADCMEVYQNHPARHRAMLAPHVAAQVRIDWCDWEADELVQLPQSLTDPGACSCGRPASCGERHRAWSRQNSLIDIRPEDAVTDDGQELFNLLQQTMMFNSRAPASRA